MTPFSLGRESLLGPLRDDGLPSDSCENPDLIRAARVNAWSGSPRSIDERLYPGRMA